MLFRDPQFLYLLLGLPLLALFYWTAFRWKRRALRALGDEALIGRLSSMSGAGRQWMKAGLLMAAFALAILALARPLWGTREEIVKRKGIDIVVCLDVSNSMLAEDIKPNRIRRAKYEIARLIDKVRGDRVGIVAFAGAAFVQCPITTDYGAAKMYLDILDPTAVAAQGTAIGDAIRKARRAFDQTERKHKVVLLITDGEDNVENPVAEAKKAAEEGVIIYTLGIGTRGGVPIPMSKSGDNVTYKKDEQGNTVLTSLNEEVLESVAAETNGRYFQAGSGGLDLDRIYDELGKIEKKEIKAALFGRFNEQFKWPLGAALLFLLTEFFISSRKRARKDWEGRFQV